MLFVILFYFATHLQDPGYVSSDTVFFNSVRKRKVIFNWPYVKASIIPAVFYILDEEEGK